MCDRDVKNSIPQKPDDILVAQLFCNVATLGGIHVPRSPVSSA